MTNSKNKRLFTLFAVLFVAIFSVGCVFSAACGKKNKEEEETHSHSYTSTVTKEATCTEDGETTYTCDCGDTYTEAIPALGHDWGAWTEVTAADCENAGSQTRTCSRCGTDDTGTIAALGHNYSVIEWNWVGDDENGYQVTATYVCANDSSHTGTTDPVTATLDGGVYTATVTIGTQTFTDTRKVASQGGEQETEGVHYFVDELGATAGDKVGGSDGADVTTNAYFTISSSAVTLEYATVSGASATVCGGTPRSFTMGLKQNDSVKVNEGGTTKAITVTANADIDLYLYIGIANDGFSSHRTGTINYSIDGVEGTPISQSNRSSVPTINVQMEAGQVLTVTATMTLDSTQADNVNGKLWLFGAEAFGYDFGDEGGTTEPKRDTYTIEITSNETTLNVGESISLGADVYKNDEMIETASVVWSASTDGGTVEINGSTIKGVSAGSVTLTATYYDEDGTMPLATATMEITVIEGVNPETAIIGTWTGYAEFTLGAYGLKGVFGADITLEVTSSYFEMTVRNIVGIDANGKSLGDLINALISDSVDLFGPGSTWTYVETTSGGYKYTAKNSEIDSFDIWLKTLDGVQYVNLTLETSYDVNTSLSIDIIITDQAVDNSSDSHPIRGVSFSEESVTFDEGLSADVTYRVKTTSGVTYAEGDYTIDYTGYESIIEVTDDKHGTITVTGKSAGTGYVTLSAGGYTTTLTVVVTPATVCGVEFGNVTGGVWTEVNSTGTLSDAPAFKATYTNGTTVEQAQYTGSDAAWTSSDTTVATIDATTGAITLLAAGVTEITVTINGCSASYLLVVGYEQITSADAIIGDWSGDVSFTAAYTPVIGSATTYTLTGVGDAAATTENISLVLTIASVTYSSSYTTEQTITILDGAALYKAGDKYYAVGYADTGYSIAEITIGGDGLTVAYATEITFIYGTSSITGKSQTHTVDVNLELTLQKVEEDPGDRVSATETGILGGVGFENQADVEFSYKETDATTGYIWIEASGTASGMTKQQALAFTSDGTAQKGDGYVVLAVLLHADEAISFQYKDGYTNETGSDEYYVIVVQLVNYGYYQFKIDGQMYVIDFTQMSKPAPEDPNERVSAGETATLGEETFGNQTDVKFKYSYTDSETGYIWIIATGTASGMTAEQAAAFTSDGTAQAGDGYVVLSVLLHACETISFQYKESYTNESGEDEYYIIVIQLINYGYYQFKIDGQMYVIDLTGMNIPRPEMVVSARNEETEFNGATFTNQTDVSFEMTSWSDGTEESTSYPWAYIEAYGTASAMKEAQVTAFETDDPIGTGYVIVSVLLHPGDTVWYASGAKSYKNNGDDDEYYGIIVALRNYGYYQFMVSSTDQMYEGVMYVVDFSGMTHAEISGQVESAADLQAALDAGVTEITLMNDVTDTADSAIITALNSVLADATSAGEAVTVIINLGGNTLDTSGSSYGIVVGNYNTLKINGDKGKLILWTNASSNSRKSDGAIYVDSGSTLIINNTIVTSTGTAIFPRADSSKVEVNGSVIYTTGYYGISTNAGTGMSDKVVIEIENSLVYADEAGHDCAAIMLNVEGTLNVKGCYIVGGRQGIILRANDSVATIKDTMVAVSGEYTSSPYASEDGTPVDNKLWSSGNEVPNAAVVLGNNTTSTSWDGTTTVEFEGVTLKVLADTPASAYFLLYAYSNKEGNSVAITMTGGGNSFSVECLGLNDGVYAGVGESGVITVNETELGEKEEEKTQISYTFNFGTIYGSEVTSSSSNITDEMTYFTETSHSNVEPDSWVLAYHACTSGDKVQKNASSAPYANYTHAVQSAGKTASDKQSYFEIDLSQYAGETVTIEIYVTSKQKGYIQLCQGDDGVSAEGILATSTTEPESGTDYTTTYKLTATFTANENLYYVNFQGATSRIYAINITIG